MGINDLWDLLKPVARILTLEEFVAEHQEEVSALHTYKLSLGVDAGPILTIFKTSASCPSHKCKHAPSAANHTQLFMFCGQIAQVMDCCNFVYDGKERPDEKRGIKVLKDETPFFKQSRLLVNSFGFGFHNAPAEGEAELAALEKHGAVNAVMTTDSNVIPLGIQWILVPDFKDSTAVSLKVTIYSAAQIEQILKLSHNCLIFYSVLAGTDLRGVHGIGQTIGMELALTGIADSLVFDYQSNTCQVHMAVLREKMCEVLWSDLSHTYGSLASYIKALSEFPPAEPLCTLILPLTSWSEGRVPPQIQDWRASIHDLEGIIRYCCEHVGWDGTRLLKQFHEKLWVGMILSMLRYLCSNDNNSTTTMT
ncbi:PINdomain-likeprotein [Moniliophthora roreri MCA 2997]|uniref:PINdomain-likeprotein n=2 Tax=Moniliophthora roreri TaxID=221103 RepID=V2W5S0_MONRO|nr:PINdomain-likeprotein [Moniliophthora roreri MCA 2997]KAI3604739.1 PINdomain-likeprotein [Moniliophthora roreri]